MAALHTIGFTFKNHKKEYPDSALSERTIRQAVKTGDLPSIQAGNRALICDEIFNRWLKGELNGK